MNHHVIQLIMMNLLQFYGVIVVDIDGNEPDTNGEHTNDTANKN